MIAPDELEYQLQQFHGTSIYHRYGYLNLTDGVAFLADAAECYWLLDIINSYQPMVSQMKSDFRPAWMSGIPFQVWKLEVNDDHSALAYMIEDTGKPKLVKQKIEFTDFPLKEMTMYLIQGVLMLPGEY